MRRTDYAALLCRDWPAAGPNPTAGEADEVVRRRAGKARIALGERPPAAPGGG